MSDSTDPRTERTLQLVIYSLLAVVLAPPVWQSGLSFPRSELWAYVAMVAAYGVWLLRGDRWLRHPFPVVGNGVYFIVLVGAFAGVYLLPAASSNQWLLAMPAMGAAAFMLRPAGIAGVGAALLAVLCWDLRAAGRPWSSIAEPLSQLAVGLVFTVACSLLALRANVSRTEAERLAAELETANAELRATSAQAAHLAAATERNRIARDIHDGLGHYLTVVTVQLQAARALLPETPARAAEAVAKAEAAARDALADVRRSVGTLRAAGPRPALPMALDGLVRESGLPASFEVVGDPRPLPESVEQALFRTVQEALTNVRKHAGPAQATVRLDFHDATHVAIEIADDGRGRLAASPDGGFGLAGLRERLAAVGGTLYADNGDGGGFVVRAEVPS